VILARVRLPILGSPRPRVSGITLGVVVGIVAVVVSVSLLSFDVVVSSTLLIIQYYVLKDG